MYAFFKLDGFDDSMEVARRLVVEAGLGLAPGAAFAPEADGWLRWCFASRDVERLVEGVRRLRGWLDANRADAPFTRDNRAHAMGGMP
jgi:aspartate/methionine/tyrosine aminotransferase